MLINLLIDFCNFIIIACGDILTFIFALLPNSPFNLIDMSSLTNFIGYLNYLIPVTEIVSILTLWTSCIGIYYIYQIVLRWVKVVE